MVHFLIPKIGQLGLNQQPEISNRFLFRSGIVDVAAGDLYTVYLGSDSTIYVMGDNSKGQYVILYFVVHTALKNWTWYCHTSE